MTNTETLTCGFIRLSDSSNKYFLCFRYEKGRQQRRPKALQSLCLLLYTVMPTLNKISYLILYYLRHKQKMTNFIKAVLYIPFGSL